MHTVGMGGPVGWDMSSFDEHVDGGTVLAAVVIRRGGQTGRKVSRGIPILSYFWFIAKWKLGIRPRPPKLDFEPMPDGFNSATGQGKDRILYSEARRVVRIGDDDYPVPPGENTLVVLVDDRGPQRTVSLESIPRLPPKTRPRYNPSMDKKQFAQVMANWHRTEMALVSAALRANPAIADFMDAPAFTP